MKNLSERQQTGAWFIIVGVLLLLFWVLSYPIVNWAISSNFIALPESKFSDDQLFVIGASAVTSLRLVSLTGIPLVLAGVAQVITGAKQSSKKKR